MVNYMIHNYSVIVEIFIESVMLMVIPTDVSVCSGEWHICQVLRPAKVTDRKRHRSWAPRRGSYNVVMVTVVFVDI